MSRRWLALSAVSVGLMLVGMSAPVYARGAHRGLAVDGEVKLPTTYSTSELAALPQTSMTVATKWRTVTDTGVLLETLVTDAAPAYPSTLLNTKNELLRVTATVRGTGHHGVTFTLGELDPSFGNHPALIALNQDGRPIADGPELVVPGDRAPIRSVSHVSEITVGVASAPATNVSPSAGSSIQVIDHGRSVTLTAGELAALPKETLNVSFGGPSGIETASEVGPSLRAVLRAADVLLTLNTWVAATGADHYVATVTPSEELVGGRPLQLSLSENGAALPQPRLVVSGDVKGGRYVSGVVDLYVGQGPAS